MDEMISRIPPNDKNAEQAILGSVFLRPDAIVDALEFVTADDFYQNANKLIFQAMNNLFDNDSAIDVVTVKDELEKNNQLEDVGGIEYLSELSESVPSASNIGYYAKIVKDKSTLRRLINSASDIVTDSFNDSKDVQDILANAESKILNISENTTDSGFIKISDAINSSLKEIDELSKNDSEVTGLSTGFRDFDKLTTGLHEDELMILAARPGVGKTAFALNIVQNVATKSKGKVAMFSLEMSASQLVNRMLCSEGSIDANHLRTGQLTDDDWKNLLVAMGSLSNTQVYIDDTPGIKMSEIRARCRRLAKEIDGLDLIIVDYLQLIEGSGQENRQQEVSMISRQLKKLAKELHVPIIALSQLSRSVEQRQDKRPVLSDIRESGSIEQDADIVSFLYRDDYYNDSGSDDEDDEQPVSDNPDVGEVEVIISKNRSGARGTIKLLFVKSYNKFSSLASIGE